MIQTNKSLSLVYLPAYILHAVLFTLTINILYHKSWKISDIEGDVVEVYDSTEGLFTKCQHFPDKYDCEDFDQFFISLPTAIIAARALMYISLTAQVISLIILPFCFDCVSLIKDFYTRAYLYRYASSFLVISGLSVGIAVSWYANLVIHEYFHHTEAGNYRYLWGRALYYGWIDMAGLLFLGILFWFIPIFENRSRDVNFDFEKDMFDDDGLNVFRDDKIYARTDNHNRFDDYI